MKIVLAVDDSPFSKHMLAYLATHAEWLAPTHDYTVVHADARLPNGLVLLLDEAQVRARHDSEAQAVFAPIRSFLDHHQVRADYVHETGDPASVVTAVADRIGAHLVIVGSRGHGPMGSLVLGSTAHKLLALSKVPVLVVR
ncbi:MAG: universal stress protein [Rhizobacter sp.]|nr:universal stress protein [Rhizobacter sp.]